ncbi:MAG: metallophosphoesterase, partial [Bacteroidota bacterium]
MIKRFFHIVLLSILCLPALHAQVKAKKPSYYDGPYLFFKGDRVVAQWVENTEFKQKIFDKGAPVSIPSSVCPDFKINQKALKQGFKTNPVINFKTDAKIAALSDVHGQYEVFVKLLQEHGIIDDKRNWSFGNGHFVIVGDIFDRGDQVTEILWLIHKLEQQAPKVEGQVHFLLGNHEVMVLTGDDRYIHKKYRYTMALLKRPLAQIFAKDTYLGMWLRSKPLAITINDMAFVHGGFSELLLEKMGSFERINQLGRTFIDTPAEEMEADSLLSFLNTMQGPLWYRGYFDENLTGKRDADKILKKINKEHIIVGHTSH